MNHRSELRIVIREAMKAQARFAAFTSCSAWSQGLDREELPAFGVSTLSEQSRSVDKETLGRTVDLTVLVKREGGDDIEDKLDDDAECIEAVLASVVDQHSLYSELVETRVQINGEGAKRTAAIALRFAVTIYTLNH